MSQATIIASPLPNDTRPVLPQRYAELDSLRGLGALTVMFHHFRRMWLDDVSLTGGWKLFDRIILQPLTIGHQAVFLFFALSGFVLSVPYLRGKGQGYPTFVLRRVLRIYAPYLFALALALAGDALWHGPHGHGAWADTTWSLPITIRLVMQHILFIGNYDWAQFNTAFWSLVLEMRVSLIFPALFALILWLRSTVAIVLAICLTCAGMLLIHSHLGWYHSVETLIVIAIFIAGILLAKHVDAVQSWYRGLSKTGRVALALVSLVFYANGDRVNRFVRPESGAEVVLNTLGAIGIMIVAMGSPSVRGLLHRNVPRFLGRISYSLYLVHGTVLFALTAACAGRLSATVQLALYLVISLLLASLFCFAIEEPFMQLSRRVGKWSTRKLDAAQSSQAVPAC